MSAITQFRERLAADEICIGASITLTDPCVTDALADSVDFFWIDLEHCMMSPEALSGHLLASRGRGKAALVRVTGSDTPFIKPILDMGDDGIIVPQVRTADEVWRIVRDCRYPPQGQRGYGPRVPSNYGRDGGAAYIARANQELFVAVQIETAEALAALDDILAIPGLDSLVLGPQDLSGALGRLGDVEHPTVVEAMQTVINKTRASGRFVGAGMGTDVGYAATMAQRGVQWLQVGGDFGYMIEAMDGIAAGIRTRLGA